jgi:hypothetical protein
VGEIIRWVTPVRHFLRHAQKDYTLRERTIRKGERLPLSYLSANRDETVFRDPFKFDICRSNAISRSASAFTFARELVWRDWSCGLFVVSSYQDWNPLNSLRSRRTSPASSSAGSNDCPSDDYDPRTREVTEGPEGKDEQQSLRNFSARIRRRLQITDSWLTKGIAR